VCNSEQTAVFDFGNIFRLGGLMPQSTRQQYHTWIDNQLTALKCQILKTKKVDPEQVYKLTWYEELRQALVRRQSSRP
jgi:hypothetical protein